MLRYIYFELICFCYKYNVYLRWWSEAYKCLYYLTHVEICDTISTFLEILASL